MKQCKRSSVFCIFMIIMLLCLTVRDVRAYNCEDGQHKEIVIYEKAPTAMQGGEITYKCELCGREYTDNIPAAEHIWGDWVTYKVSTCTQEGRRHRTCSLHSAHDEAETIPATGHQYVETTDEPTCIKDGAKIFTCSLCGDTYTETYGSSLGHQYKESILKETSCIEDGLKAFTCEVDGESYTQPIPATGHSFGEWITQGEAKEGVPGKRYRECADCGLREEEEIPALLKQQLFNKNDIIIGSVNLSLIGFFTVLIAPYVKLNRWYRKKQKLFSSKQVKLSSGSKKFK